MFFFFQPEIGLSCIIPFSCCIVFSQAHFANMTGCVTCIARVVSSVSAYTAAGNKRFHHRGHCDLIDPYGIFVYPQYLHLRFLAVVAKRLPHVKGHTMKQTTKRPCFENMQKLLTKQPNRFSSLTLHFYLYYIQVRALPTMRVLLFNFKKCSQKGLCV